MNPLGGFSYDDARVIHQRVLGQQFAQKPLDMARHQTTENKGYYVLLSEDLAAATDELTGYSQAEATVIKYVPSVDSLDMEEATTTDGTITVTNRNRNFSALAGDLLYVTRHIAEWVPSTAGGGSSSSSSGACCGCIDNGNIVVDTIETSSKMSVSLNDVFIYQSNGYIKLPAGVYELTYSSGSGTWTLDIGDFLVAFYNDGTSATSGTTMDGTLTFDNATGGKSQLQLCITGTVGESISARATTAGATNGWNTGYFAGYNSVRTYTGTADTTPGTGSGTGGAWTGTYAETYNTAWLNYYNDGYYTGTAWTNDTGTSDTPCGFALYQYISGVWTLIRNCDNTGGTCTSATPTGTAAEGYYQQVQCTGDPTAGTGIGPGP